MIAGVEARRKLSQVINDTVFSFGELAYQEFETSKHLITVLEQNGFSVERDVRSADRLGRALGLWRPGDRDRLGPRLPAALQLGCPSSPSDFSFDLHEAVNSAALVPGLSANIRVALIVNPPPAIGMMPRRRPWRRRA